MARKDDIMLSAYIKLLQNVLQTEGDIVVVTPGFDEDDYDPAAEPIVIKLTDTGRDYGHRGVYERPEDRSSNRPVYETFKAVLINF